MLDVIGLCSITSVAASSIEHFVVLPCVQVMAREIFNPNLALFVSVPEGGTTFQPNANSVVQSDTGVSHLEFFKFVGRLVGKALYDGQLMDAYFTRSFYKHMLGQQLTYEVGSGQIWATGYLQHLRQDESSRAVCTARSTDRSSNKMVVMTQDLLCTPMPDDWCRSPREAGIAHAYYIRQPLLTLCRLCLSPFVRLVFRTSRLLTLSTTRT